MASLARWGLGFSVVVGLTGIARLLTACGETVNPGTDSSTPTQETGSQCGMGLTLCGGQCVDLQRDPSNCGMCSNSCNTTNAEVCSMGMCSLACGGGTTKCGTMCFDTQRDPNNCGACGTKCDPGFLCADGGCSLTCMNGYQACPSSDAGTRCVNPQTDDRNCGMCGKACDPGFKCDMGNCTISCQQGLSVCQVDGGDRCVDLRVDMQNCGTCGKVCEAGTFCSGPPPLSDGGDAGAPTCGLGCFGGTVKCGNKCADTKIDPFNCGNCFQACDGGQTCVNSTCQ